MKNKFICVRVETPDHIDPREHLEEVITTGIDLAARARAVDAIPDMEAPPDV